MAITLTERNIIDKNMCKSLRYHTYARMAYLENFAILISDASHKSQYVATNTAQPQL